MRIIICGLNGVGKSTLGKALADRMNYRFVDVEDLFFSKTDGNYIYESPRTEEEVKKLLLDILHSEDNLVFSSVNGEYVEDFSFWFHFCIILEAPKNLRMERVQKRSWEKFGKRMLQGGDLYEKEQSFFAFAQGRKENLVNEWSNTLSIPITRFNGEKPVDENVDDIIKKIVRLKN